jgi:hypothetical protein
MAILLLALPTLGTLTGWVVSPPRDSVLERYDFTSGSGYRAGLPPGLREVSGLATSPDGRLFAHNDERGVIYQIDPVTGEALKAFAVGSGGVPGDFEGIAIAGERFFLLTSAGQLLEFREGEHGASVGYRTHPLNLMNYCEMEGLAVDEEAGSLLLPCKTPRARDLRGHLVVLSVPLATMTPTGKPRVFIPLEELDDNGLGDEFHPSAIEIHPETRSLLVLAGPEEALAEIGPGGEILGTREFKKRDHPQPEGIAFLQDGTLVVSDEGQDGLGTLTRYRPREDPEGSSP